VLLFEALSSALCSSCLASRARLLRFSQPFSHILVLQARISGATRLSGNGWCRTCSYVVLDSALKLAQRPNHADHAQICESPYPRHFIFARSLLLILSIISDSADEGMVSAKFSRKVSPFAEPTG
jgi:hypothetical protein